MDKSRRYSLFLAGLLLVVGALAWLVVPSAAFADDDDDENKVKKILEANIPTMNSPS